MNRQCPSCFDPVVPVQRLLLSDAHCPSCRALIGVHRLYGAFFLALTLIVTLVSTLAVLAQQGLYAALLWLPLPVGAISYVKARFCPLVSRPTRSEN